MSPIDSNATSSQCPSEDLLTSRLRATFRAVKDATPEAGTAAVASVIVLGQSKRHRATAFAAAAFAVAAVAAGIVVVSALRDDARAVAVRTAVPRTDSEDSGLAEGIFDPDRLDPDGYLLSRLDRLDSTVAIRPAESQEALVAQSIQVTDVPFGDVAPDMYRHAETARPYSLGTFTDPERSEYWSVVVIADAPNGVDGMLGMVPDGEVAELASIQPTKKYTDPFGRGAEGFRFSANGIEVAVVGTGITPDDLEKIGENITNGPRSTSSGESSSALIVKNATTLPEATGGMPDGQVLQYSPMGWVRSNTSRVPEAQTFAVHYATTSEPSDSEIAALAGNTTQSLMWNDSELITGGGRNLARIRAGVGFGFELSGADETMAPADPSSTSIAADASEGGGVLPLPENFVGVNHAAFEILAATHRIGLAVENDLPERASDCVQPREAFGWSESATAFSQRCDGGALQDLESSTTSTSVMPMAMPDR